MPSTNLRLQKEIAERKRIEGQLRRIECLLAQGQRLSHTGSWAWNAVSGELYWSAEHYRILGLDPQTTKASYPAMMNGMHPDDRAFVHESYEKAIRERGVFDLDYRIVRADGAVRYVHNLAHPVSGDTGELVEYVGTIIDTTDRRDAQAQAQLRAAVARTEMLLDCIPERFFCIDADWRYSFFNQHAEQQLRMLGKNPLELIGKPLWEDLPNPDLELQLRRAMAERVVVTHECYFEPIGEWIDMRIYPSPDGGLAVFHSDVTERKRSEEALRQANRELARVTRVMTVGEMASSIAHQVSQPLAAVVTQGAACLRWLRRDIPDIGEAEVCVERIVRDTARVGDVIGALRSLVERRHQSQPAPVVLNEVIEKAVILMKDELSEHRVRLRTILCKELPAVLGDRTQLEQVLLNLIVNGKEAMAAAPTRELDVSSTTAGEEVIVSVKDTGTGLFAAAEERIFDAFYTTKEGGLGLGLSISRNIVEAHEGKLMATNNDGAGATFYMVLPKIPG